VAFVVKDQRCSLHYYQCGYAGRMTAGKLLDKCVYVRWD
jgi:hypothetical protein